MRPAIHGGGSLRERSPTPFVLALLALVGLLGAAPAPPNGPRFGDRVDEGLIQFDAITEASGIASSRRNAEVLWVHDDSGDRAALYAVGPEGRHLGVYLLKGAENRDWEDIAVGPGPDDGTSYLYVGDIGDNRAKDDLKYIYRVPEPRVSVGQVATETTLHGVDTIAFRFPDGDRDAETLMLDPLTKDLYVVSKREARVHVYRAPYPQSTTAPTTLELVTTLTLPGGGSLGGRAVAGDISPSGREILIKTYLAVYYWARAPGQTVREALAAAPRSLPYVPEPQGEGVCWKADGMGYYTVSEEWNGIPAHLYYYPRLPPNP